MLKRVNRAVVATARVVLPASARRRIVDRIGRRRFKDSMITRESRSHSFLRRTLTTRRPTLRHLDIHVTDHCNLGCKSCEHYSPLCKPWFAQIGATKAELARLTELFDDIEQIYLLGGEPLLHPDVAAFVYATRAAFPNTRVCLMTNGLLVTRMDETVWKALNETGAILLCDDYPVRLPKDQIEALASQHEVTVEWMKPATEFFKAPINPAGTCDPEGSFTACQWLSNCAIIRDGRLFPCAHVAFADAPAEAFGLPQIVPTEDDSIDIFSARDGDEVIRFLTSPVPWCRFCDYEHTETFAWERTSRTADEWISGEWLDAHHDQSKE